VSHGVVRACDLPEGFHVSDSATAPEGQVGGFRILCSTVGFVVSTWLPFELSSSVSSATASGRLSNFGAWSGRITTNRTRTLQTTNQTLEPTRCGGKVVAVTRTEGTRPLANSGSRRRCELSRHGHNKGTTAARAARFSAGSRRPLDGASCTLGALAGLTYVGAHARGFASGAEVAG
jgi:hypothetical protein